MKPQPHPKPKWPERGPMWGIWQEGWPFLPLGTALPRPSPSPTGRTMAGEPFPGQASTQSALGPAPKHQTEPIMGKCWGSWTV